MHHTVNVSVRTSSWSCQCVQTKFKRCWMVSPSPLSLRRNPGDAAASFRQLLVTSSRLRRISSGWTETEKWTHSTPSFHSRTDRRRQARADSTTRLLQKAPGDKQQAQEDQLRMDRDREMNTQHAQLPLTHRQEKTGTGRQYNSPPSESSWWQAAGSGGSAQDGPRQRNEHTARPASTHAQTGEDRHRQTVQLTSFRKLLVTSRRIRRISSGQTETEKGANSTPSFHSCSDRREDRHRQTVKIACCLELLYT